MLGGCSDRWFEDSWPERLDTMGPVGILSQVVLVLDFVGFRGRVDGDFGGSVAFR